MNVSTSHRDSASGQGAGTEAGPRRDENTNWLIHRKSPCPLRPQTTQACSWEADSSSQALFLCLPPATLRTKTLGYPHWDPPALLPHSASATTGPAPRDTPALQATLTHLPALTYNPELPVPGPRCAPITGRPWASSVGLEQAC